MLKFVGGYHGHVDALLAQAGSGMATLAIPSTPGVPAAVTADTLLCAYNDLDGARALAERHGDDLACVIVEPVAGNMGVVAAQPGFLEGLRTICNGTGALLVLDEVITGFRVAYGGAQERLAVRPDLTCLGKIVGGGLPAAAFGGRGRRDGAAGAGRRRLPGRHAVGQPAGDGGRAGDARAAARAGRLRAARADSARGSRRGWPAPGVTVNRVGAMLTAFFTGGPVTDFADAAASDTTGTPAFHAAHARPRASTWRRPSSRR